MAAVPHPTSVPVLERRSERERERERERAREREREVDWQRENLY